MSDETLGGFLGWLAQRRAEFTPNVEGREVPVRWKADALMAVAEAERILGIDRRA